MSLYQPFISYSRGFAITTIVLFHFLKHTPLSEPLSKAIYLGGAGVHLFFFISGYGLIASRYEGAIDFYTRRFRKILIPYFIIITAIFLLNIPLKLYSDGWHEYLGHIFLYKMFSPSTSSFGGHFWYMSVIIQFYLFFPLIRNLFIKVPPYKAVYIALIISLLYSAWVVYIGQADARHFNSFFLQYLWEFVLGMAVFKTGILEKLISRPLWAYIILAVIGYGIMGILVVKGGTVGKVYNDYFSFLAYLSVCILTYRMNLFSRPLFYLDNISFPLYLTHYFVIHFYLIKVINERQFRLIDLPFAIALAVLIGIISNRLLIYLEKRRLAFN